MKILVTGGAGFIGSHLIIRLLDEGHKVICIDNLNAYYDPKLKEDRLRQFLDKIKFYKVDITDKEALEIVFLEEKIDKICHLAAQAGVRYSLENPFIYADTNYIGTLNILELAKKYKIKDIVFASTSSIYGMNKRMPFKEDDVVDNPVSIYAATKRGCELLGYSYCHLYGLNFIALRFFTVYGEYGRPDMALFKFTEAILNGKKIDVYNKGKMERDFTYVGDIVEGFLKAVEKIGVKGKNLDGFNIINLGCGNPVKLMDFISVLEKKLGKKAKKNMMKMQPGDVVKTYADISKARRVLGYKPKVMVEDGVKRFVSWYKGYYGVKI